MQIWCEPAAPDPAASAVALNSTACKMSVRTSCEADPAARGFIAVNHPVIPSGDDAALSLSSVSPVSKTVFPKVSSEDLVGSASFFVSWPSPRKQPFVDEHLPEHHRGDPLRGGGRRRGTRHPERGNGPEPEDQNRVENCK